MATYDARRGYDAALTARDYSELLQKVQQPPPEGALWLVLAPRRYGKTWTLRELEHRLGASACYLELRLPTDKKTWASGKKVQPGGYWLLDELSGLIEAGDQAQSLKAARDFLSRCEKLRAARTNVILALTPRELHQLQSADERDGRISFKSILRLESLSDTEARRLARTPEAHGLLAEVPPDWRRTPFLLELLLEVDERARRQGAPLEGRLLKTVLDASENASHRYFHQVFWDALTDEHRELLRAIVRNEKVASHACEPLVEARLVEEDAATGRRWIADPVLAARLTPVRIHHLSDVHVGPKSAQSIDAKEAGLLAEAVDPGVVRESYLTHLEGLRRSGKAPHLLIISGDLTEWATRDQCAEARRWLDRIAPLLEPHLLLGEGAQRILLVGGNHDVDWSRTRGEGERARHQNFAEFFEGYAHPHLEKPPAERKLEVLEWLDLGITVLLLGTSELGGQIEEERERYKLLQELAKLPRAPNPQEKEKAEKLATDAARIDPGLVHEQDLHRISTHSWHDKLPVRIAVMHHPLSPLPSTEVARYSGLLNAGAVKQVLMEKGFSLVLCGHAHSGWFAEERWLKHSGGRTLRIAAAPSLGSREIAENNGFNLVEIFRDRDRNGLPEYQLRVRRFVRQGERVWEEHSDQMGPFSPGS
ncbi:metallophosphoesterase [Archangium sp.]|uniref:metallophosphoesterase family protein n=1 Tax=Archangium sp. TaxID=1872627 RepID=UPI002D37D2FA|nr:metallophosphoesterase [Archangium sp.]HYO52380.1 metallophosphoesterase [Archangium sp.]